MTYQDVWFQGQLLEKGERDCETRYQAVRHLAQKYKRPFTVLDIGANTGYFVTRLAEEFPNCVCVAIEPTYHRFMKIDHLPNVVVLAKETSVDDLKALAKCEHFDIVLGLSVLHCLPGDLPYQEILDAFLSLGSHLVIDLPTEGKSLGNRQAEMAELISRLGEPAAKVDSHVEVGESRPLFVLKGKTIASGCRSRFGVEYESDRKLSATFSKVHVDFPRKLESRTWIPGINLWTYIQLDGVYPSRKTVSDLVKAADWELHHDICPWNVILSGTSVSVIDRDDPGHKNPSPASEVDKIAAMVLNCDKTFTRE